MKNRLITLIVAAATIMTWSLAVKADVAGMGAGTWIIPGATLRYTWYSRNRDGSSDAARTNRAVYAYTTSGLNALAPTTNDVDQYCDIVNGELTNTYPTMPNGFTGSKNSQGGDGTFDGGEYLMQISHPAAGRRAFTRVFSTGVPTNSAYYFNSPAVAMAVGITWYNDGRSITSNNNPCFKRLMFAGTNSGVATPGTPWTITGQVLNVSAAGGNNILDQDDFRVYWRTNNTYAWEPLNAFSWVGDGGYQGTYRGGSEMIVAPVGGANLLPNSMLIGGQQPLAPVVVPEPGLALVGLAVAFLLKKR